MTSDRLVIGGGQVAPVFLDKQSNLEKIRSFAEEAKRRDARLSLMAFPECATTGYVGFPKGRSDMSLVEAFHKTAEPVGGPTTEFFSELARDLAMFVASGFVERDPNIIGLSYNSVILVDPSGKVAAVHRKCHTAPSERSYFRPGTDISIIQSELGVLGLSICYDLWYPEFVRAQARKGLELHINVTGNIHDFIIGSTHVPIVRAAENGVFMLSVNRVGKDEPTGNEFGGCSCIVGPTGRVVAALGDEEGILVAEIDPEEIVHTRSRLPIFKDMREDLYHV